jgi:hypothetical protein
VGPTQESVYSYVQGLFRRGVVIIVGSGASSGYGLPGMSALSTYLLEHIPSRLSGLPNQCVVEWDRISDALKTDAGLEAALGHGELPDQLIDLVTELVADCVQGPERAAIASILGSQSVSGLGRLLEHILSTAPLTDVVTTNYDRLIEVHAAKAGVRVDSMYYGHTVGRLDAALSRDELYFAQTVAGRPRTASFVRHPHVRLSKPHGSLDWFTHKDEHFRSDLTVPGARRIIAPGGNKYRLGYEAPYDAHRTRANDAIDNAAAMFFVGYGFNDDHLQTHVRSRFPHVPIAVLSHRLTENALEYLTLNETAIGIESGTDEKHCRIRQGSAVLELDIPLWDLEHLMKEVLAI